MVALRHGTIPLAWAAEERDVALEAYVQRHLREEIRAEALLRAVKRQLGPVLAEEIGPLFEGFVLHLLRAHAEEQKLFDELTYWAPAQAMRTEVDFLLRRQREFIAIEVKASKRFERSMVQGAARDCAIARCGAAHPRLCGRSIIACGRGHRSLANPAV